MLAFPDILDGLLDRNRYFDVHSHVFAASRRDWQLTQLLTFDFGPFHMVPNTSTVQKIESLVAFQDLGVDRMVISSFFDAGSAEGGSPGLDGWELDEVTAYAYGLYPDYFIPFTRAFQQEMGVDHEWAWLYVAVCLSYGFMGVGELIIHGHGTALFAETDALERIVRVAWEANVPISLHWEFIAHDDADESYDKLIELLDRFPDIPVAFPFGGAEGTSYVFIIAHCGLGPNEPVDVSEYSSRLDALLAYDRVRFDISGMQVDATQKLLNLDGTLTDVGEMLLEKMKDHPERFMWGLDVETRTGGTTAAWEQVVADLETFLDAGSLSTEEKRMIKYTNAQGIFS